MKNASKNSINSRVSGQIQEFILVGFELPNYSPKECGKWHILTNGLKTKTL